MVVVTTGTLLAGSIATTIVVVTEPLRPSLPVIVNESVVTELVAPGTAAACRAVEVGVYVYVPSALSTRVPFVGLVLTTYVSGSPSKSTTPTLPVSAPVDGLETL